MKVAGYFSADAASPDAKQHLKDVLLVTDGAERWAFDRHRGPVT